MLIFYPILQLPVNVVKQPLSDFDQLVAGSKTGSEDASGSYDYFNSYHISTEGSVRTLYYSTGCIIPDYPDEFWSFTGKLRALIKKEVE